MTIMTFSVRIFCFPPFPCDNITSNLPNCVRTVVRNYPNMVLKLSVYVAMVAGWTTWAWYIYIYICSCRNIRRCWLRLVRCIDIHTGGVLEVTMWMLLSVFLAMPYYVMLCRAISMYVTYIIIPLLLFKLLISMSSHDFRPRYVRAYVY